MTPQTGLSSCLGTTASRLGLRGNFLPCLKPLRFAFLPAAHTPDFGFLRQTFQVKVDLHREPTPSKTCLGNIGACLPLTSLTCCHRDAHSIPRHPVLTLPRAHSPCHSPHCTFIEVPPPQVLLPSPASLPGRVSPGTWCWGPGRELLVKSLEQDVPAHSALRQVRAPRTKADRMLAISLTVIFAYSVRLPGLPLSSAQAEPCRGARSPAPCHVCRNTKAKSCSCSRR